MLLNQLLTVSGLASVPSDIEISGITADSRKVEKGFLFAALPGVKADGTAFLTSAAQNGAAAALVPQDADLPELPLVYIRVSDTRRALAEMAAAFYGRQPETVVAVTGTNGKTSTANFVREIYDFLGKKAASVGTLGILTADFAEYGSLTTPDSVTLHAELKMLAEKGYEHAAIEASSHGIEQHRIDGIRLTAAAFTNITRDHLDYHKTMENYLDAKLKLFDRPLSSKTAVLNADIPQYEQIAAYCRAKGLKIIDYGEKAEAVRLKDHIMDINSQLMHLDVMGHSATVRLPLAGTFQAMNALCALGLVIAAGEDPERAAAALAELKGAPGRLELVGERANGASVYVDYAHTPDALETVLKALRPHTEKRLCVVFGCGGDRDPGKRPQMGAIAEELADIVYVTDDNPRSEEPASIRAAILSACPKAVNIGSRALAIRTAVAGLEEGDILVIAGKGHETGQLVKGIMHPFDDRDAARKAIDEADTPLWAAKEAAIAADGKIIEDFNIYGISIDTRTICKGDLYVAIKGETLNGHDYAAAAIEKGAAGVLVSYIPTGVPPEQAIVVADTQKALEAMAHYARRRSKAKVIGITGSSGKTSTKEMLRTALTAVGKTHTTAGNLNNNIGMPLTLARLPADADFAVIEMGMNHKGEMTELTMLAEPDAAMITMIGSAHCEFFKTQEETAHAKAEIFKGMKPEGIVFLNADDKHFALLKKEAEKCGLKDIRSFGSTADDTVALLNAGETDTGSTVTAKIGTQTYTYTIHLPGRHQIQNSLGVAGILKALDVDMASALQSLGQLQTPKGRGQRFEINSPHGTFILIDDAYNANPESMQAGIRVLGSLQPKGQGRRVAVIGDMLELGETAEELHKNLAKDLIENKVDVVYAVGPNTGALFDILPESMKGIKKPVSSEIAEIICNEIKADDIVFVKGSFGSRMAKIVDVLKNFH